MPHGRSGRAENLVPTGIRSRTVQPVVSHYTDWAIGPTMNWKNVDWNGHILIKGTILGYTSAKWPEQAERQQG